MKLSLFAQLVALTSAYGVNRCRQFNENQMVQDFSLDDFSGQWFPIYESESMDVTGRCPVAYFERLQPSHPTMATRLAKMSAEKEHFSAYRSYKGHAGIVDNFKKFRGYFDKGTSNGSLWVGATLRPLRKFEDNFQVVSTDYYNYAIVYTCTFLTSMYNQDQIIIYTRQTPALEEIDPVIMQTIRSEFDRIFGSGLEKGSVKEGQQQEDQDQDEFLKQPDQNTTAEANVTGSADATETAEEMQEGVGHRGQYKSPRLNKVPGDPLDFDTHLRHDDHEGCDQLDSYPDLSLSLTQRNKLREERLRAERQMTQKTQRAAREANRINRKQGNRP